MKKIFPYILCLGLSTTALAKQESFQGFSQQDGPSYQFVFGISKNDTIKTIPMRLLDEKQLSVIHQCYDQINEGFLLEFSGELTRETVVIGDKEFPTLTNNYEFKCIRGNVDEVINRVTLHPDYRGQ